MEKRGCICTSGHLETGEAGKWEPRRGSEQAVRVGLAHADGSQTNAGQTPRPARWPADGGRRTAEGQAIVSNCWQSRGDGHVRQSPEAWGNSVRAAPGPTGSQHHLRSWGAAQGPATRGRDEGDGHVTDVNHKVGQCGPRHRCELTDARPRHSRSLYL